MVVQNSFIEITTVSQRKLFESWEQQRLDLFEPIWWLVQDNFLGLERLLFANWRQTSRAKQWEKKSELMEMPLIARQDC